MTAASDDDGPDSVELLQQYRDGDSAAANELYQRYADRLLALARSRLSERLARRLDAEDVLQSAYRSFFVRARKGEFSIEQSGDLWKLLAAIVLNKLRRQAKRHRTAKRDMRSELELSRNDESTETANTKNREPSVVDLLLAADELSWLLAHFEPNQRVAIESRLKGHSFDEIAAMLNVNERTVRRWLDTAQHLLMERRERLEQDSASRIPSCPNFADPSDGDPTFTLSPRDYVLDRLIGSGGVCKVYAARQRNSGRPVCVKVLRRNLRQNARYVQWFIGEASLVSRLSHPNIVSIYGLGRLPNGGYFMDMELVDGENLGKRLSKAVFSESDAVKIVETVANAIEHAHERGVLHGDVKPQNVLIDVSGKVWLTDFGFGRTLTDGPDQLQSHSFTGTPGFMAPEQEDPSRGNLGPWTDVYGIGMLLHALITCQPANGVISETISAEIRQIVEKCITEDWRGRYASAKELSAALTAVPSHSLASPLKISL